MGKMFKTLKMARKIKMEPKLEKNSNTNIDLVHLSRGTYSQIEGEVLKEVSNQLRGTVSVRNVKEISETCPNIVTTSRLSDEKRGDTWFLSHSLRDRNNYLTKAKQNKPIESFQLVFVPGQWLKDRILRERPKIDPNSIVIVNHPRIEILREIQDNHNEEKSSKVKLLWAPSQKRTGSKLTSTYPEFLKLSKLLPEKFELTSILHPKDRSTDKKPISVELVNCDIVVSDCSSVVFEAWALGKPVVFPRWIVKNSVIERFPESAEAHIHKNRIGLHADSFEEFLRIISSNPKIDNLVDSFMEQYLCNYRSTSHAHSIALNSKEFLTRHKNIETIEQLESELKAQLQAKDWKNSEKNLQLLISYNSKNARYFDELAKVLRAQFKWGQEAEALKKVIEIGSSVTAFHHFRLGEAQERMKYFKAAARSYEVAISVRKESDKNYNMSEWYYRTGYAFAEDGHDGGPDNRQSKAMYKLACDADESLGAKSFGIGVFHQKRGYWKLARDAYMLSLQKDIWNADLAFKAGMANDRCYFWDDAEKLYALAIQQNAENYGWIFRLGLTQERQGKFLTAAETYAKGQKIAPNVQRYWQYREGYSLYKAGKYEEACASFLKISKSTPFLTKNFSELNDGAVKSSTEWKVAHSASLEPSSRDFSTKTEPNTPLRDLQTENAILGVKEVLNVDLTVAEAWHNVAKIYEDLSEDWNSAADFYKKAIDRSNDHRPDWFYSLGMALNSAGRHEEACQAFVEFRTIQSPHGLDEKNLSKDRGLRDSTLYNEYRSRLDILDKSVLLESYHGESISCNPLAIFKKMIEDERFSNWTYYWVIQDREKISKSFKSLKNVIFVERDSDLYLRLLARVKYLINNNTFPPYFSRRPLQKYLNTWHGTPIKTLGINILPQKFEHRNAARNFLHSTDIIIQNDHTQEVLTNGHGIGGIVPANIIETGYPRIDLTLDETERSRVRKLLGVSDKTKLILYAPTYRGSSLANNESENEEFEKISSFLQQLRHSNYEAKILFRGHHLQEKRMAQLKDLPELAPIDLDTNSLLAAVDILVTDYSSIAFDFLPTKRPIVFFAFDYEAYKAERGLYFPLERMSSRISITLEDAVSATEEAMEGGICLKNSFCNKFIKREDGKSTSKVINEFFFGKKKSNLDAGVEKHKILTYAGAFIPNGITNSFLSLTENLDPDRYEIYAGIDPNSVSGFDERLQQMGKVGKSCNILPRIGHNFQTFEGNWITNDFTRTGNFTAKEKEKIFFDLLKEEFVRVFGYSKFDTIINFEGYVGYWNNLLSQKNEASVGAQSVVYLHNDMWREHQTRFRHLNRNFLIYQHYERLISVSKATSKLNMENLSDRFDLEKSRFDFVDNCLRADRIIDLSEELLDEDSLNFFENRKTFVNVARLSIEKGHDRLIRAFSIIVDEDPDAALAIVGDGPLYNSLDSLIKELGLSKNVRLFGYQENPFKFVKAADCFVFSSFYEGQGLVALEALIIGLPVISTDFPCIHDVLEHGRYGKICENSIDGLLSSMREYLKFGSNFEAFDGASYQEGAVEMFYKKVCSSE